MEQELELIEKAMGKQAFLEACVDEYGGIRFSKDNVKVGYHVRLDKFGLAEVVGAGPQNITYRILTGGSKGMLLKAAYAEITEIVRAEGTRETHFFTVGERFTAEQYICDGDSYRRNRVRITYEIIKATSATIQLKPVDGDGTVIARKPKKSYNGDWYFSVDDTCGNTFYKTAVTSETTGMSGK